MGFLSKFFGKPKLDYQSRYELLKAAISGTMSKVYQAKDRKTGEIVALKILDKQKTADLEMRFKGTKRPSEGEIAIQFDHPYIVRTLEYGTTTDNCHYIVMEYLGGTGLNNVLVHKQDLMAGARMFYIRQAAEALQAVHEKGFIHRDICPRNLIFTGDFNILKLTDFGLSVPNREPFTLPGNRTGTPNYMAPELVRRRNTDHRLDIFSFGVTVYELCTRQLPWPRGTDGLAAMSHDQPGAPITDFRPDINKKLASAIHYCIESDIKKRCPDMATFLRMIAKVEYEDEKSFADMR
ncbi:MAG: serine/threonine protein kinase [Planctomycetaceae bacterium]|jgi:serine/threonine-protein kinase|nr:serine/threonine protein kinase [Planctomycetaceae bacterium]